MSIKRMSFAVLSLALLAGCASKQNINVVKAADGSSVEVAGIFTPQDMNNNLYADTKLREVTPAHSGAGMGLAAVTALLGGGISTGSFDKNNYKGTRIDNMPEPSKSYLVPKAEKLVSSWLEKNGKGYNYDQTLFIAAAQWSLIYKDLSAGNSDYDLTYRIKFYKRPEGGNMLSAYVFAECAPTPESGPLSEWQANNYQKVTQVTQKFMDGCLLELDNQLPRLLAQKN